MSACLALLSRAAIADLCLNSNERRTLCILLGSLDSHSNRINVIAILHGNRLESKGAHTLLHILTERNICASLDGNAVGIVEYNEL